MEDLRLKYRPESISQIWGNDHIKTIWSGFVKKSSYPKSIVLYGSFGVAKTTLARILAKDITAKNTRFGNGFFENIYEIDAATYDIVHTWRSIYIRALYAHEPIAIFLDEAQRLVDRAQDAFLKTIEDSVFLHFIFATTEKDRIDGGILSRSTKFLLMNPPADVLLGELSKIAENENIAITKEALQYLINLSKFNPRECLGSLNTMRGQEGLIDAGRVKELLDGSIGY